MARTALLVSCALMLLSAACTDDFSRFKFGKKVPSTHDAGSQNVTGTSGNSAQSRIDASTAEANVQQKAAAGSGQPQARGPRSGSPDAGADPRDRDD